jgi:uncharacterized damage-inducible protein DinB
LSFSRDPEAPADDRSKSAIASLADLLTRAATDLAHVAHAVRPRDDWDERWLDVRDDPPREKTYGGAIAHVITHSMHHRAQVLYMLRRLALSASTGWQLAGGQRTSTHPSAGVRTTKVAQGHPIAGPCRFRPPSFDV